MCFNKIYYLLDLYCYPLPNHLLMSMLKIPRRDQTISYLLMSM